MSEPEKGRSSYLDLLVATLMEHEKDLDRLVGRLEETSEKLSAMRKKADSGPAGRPVGKEKGGSDASDSETLVYMKIKLDRPIDEVVRIIESLKG
jgi:hypothetical protein